MMNDADENLASKFTVLQADRLARSVSHDLMASIRAVLGFSELLMSDMNAGEGINETFVEHIHTGAQNAVERVEALRSYSRDMRNLPVLENCLASDVLSKLGLASDAVDAQVRINKLLLDRVIAEIMDNIDQHAVVQSEAQETYRIEARLSDEALVIDIQDFGPGVLEGQLSHLFDLFFKADPDAKGLGMGLAFAQLYMEQMNGSIRARNSQDAGLIIELSLLLV